MHDQPTEAVPRSTATALVRAHGLFNVASGLWPLLHRRSFEAVLGPKTDYWLAGTVGALLVSNGLAQLRAGNSQDGRAAARALGVGTASVLALVDVVEVARGRISPVYLADAAVEAAWVWALSTVRESRD